LEEVKSKISFSYRLPNTNEVFVYKAVKFFFINDIKEIENLEGFVFAPFDKINKSVFIAKNDFLFADDISLEEEGSIYSYAEINKDQYIEKGKTVKNFILNTDLDKVVYSRVIKVSNMNYQKVKKSFNKLLINHQNAFVYYLSIEKIGTWFGSTPEKLIILNDNMLETVALAGTKKFDDKLDWGDKEIQEQNFVAEYISNNFDILGLKPIKSKRFTLAAGNVKHLCNTFTLSESEIKFSDFVSVFHPTPAIAGLPKEKSIVFIKEIENQDRGFYAGYLGVKLQNDIKIFVNLRCANYQNKNINIFVGGGYTKDSDVENEWKETLNKSKTILDTLN